MRHIATIFGICATTYGAFTVAKPIMDRHHEPARLEQRRDDHDRGHYFDDRFDHHEPRDLHGHPGRF
ncbi:MAG TPA: hypothetical protein VGG19_11530 [Tepidisphaeraceae bacterium]